MAARKPPSVAVPVMMAELAAASAETIWHRSALMWSGACSAAEYQRMVLEKLTALQLSGIAMMTGGDMQAALRPFHKRARANARRLRRGA